MSQFNGPTEVKTRGTHLADLQKIVALAKIHRWGNVGIVGRGEMPYLPFFQDGFWYVPLDQDHSAIPPWVMRRVRTVIEAGVKFKGFVVKHEAPALLEAPQPKRKDWKPPEVNIPWQGIGKLATKTLTVAASVAKVGLAAAGVAALLAAYTLGAALMAVDPGIIIVLTEEEGSWWVQLAAWEE